MLCTFAGLSRLKNNIACSNIKGQQKLPFYVGTDVHKGFNKHTETVQSYFQKRTFFNNPLLRYNVFAKEDFAL